MKTLLLGAVICSLFCSTALAQYRLVNGKAYNVSDPNAWTPLHSSYEVLESRGNLLICVPFTTLSKSEDVLNKNKFHGVQTTTRKMFSLPLVAFVNFDHNFQAGTDFQMPMRAIFTGARDMYVIGRGLCHGVEVYDFGVPYSPPAQPLTPAQKDAAIEKKKAQDQKVFNWLQTQATNGSASAQCELGEKYIKGQSCETNVALGTYWLKKSSAQGNDEATKALIDLK